MSGGGGHLAQIRSATRSIRSLVDLVDETIEQAGSADDSAGIDLPAPVLELGRRLADEGLAIDARLRVWLEERARLEDTLSVLFGADDGEYDRALVASGSELGFEVAMRMQRRIAGGTCCEPGESIEEHDRAVTSAAQRWRR